MRNLIRVGFVSLFSLSAYAKPANIFHYACKGEDARYAVTVNLDRHMVKVRDQGPSGTLTTFHILKDDDDCGKGGWTLNDNASFCYATQGDGSLTWHGKDWGNVISGKNTSPSKSRHADQGRRGFFRLC
jgi:hypothetical protein